MFKDNITRFRFRLRAGNYEIILVSESYNFKSSCLDGIASVQKNCTNDSNYLRKKAQNGDHYFVLLAPNHEAIGTSEMYSSAGAMENGILSVMQNGITTNVVDLS